MSDENSKHEAMTPENLTLADRADARIRRAELEFEAAKNELAIAAVKAVEGKREYEEFHRLATPIKNLAPLIRNEMNALERLWRQAEQRKGKLTDSRDAASKELKSVSLAREQLKQMGLYVPSSPTPQAAAQASGP